MLPRLLTAAAAVAAIALAAPARAADAAAPVEPSAPPAPPQRNRIEIGLGAVSLQLRDDALAPLRWTGWGAELGLGYERRWDDGLLRVRGALPFALTQNRYDYGGAALAPELGVQYTHVVARFPWGGQLGVGGRLRGRMMAQFYYDWNEEHLYWLTTYDASPLIRFDTSFGERHAISAEAGLPLFSLVSRPPAIRYYKIDNLTNAGAFLSRAHEGMRPASLDTYVAPDLQLAYTFRASRRVLLRGSWTLAYAREAEPARFQALAQTLSATLAIAF